MCYLIGSVVKIVLHLHFFYSKDDRLRQIKKKHETFFNINKEIVAQVFSCEFCEISWNSFSYRVPPVAASVY